MKQLLRVIFIFVLPTFIWSCAELTHELANNSFGETWNMDKYIHDLTQLQDRGVAYPFIENAFKYDVDFMMSYLMIHDFEKAEEHFQKAVDLLFTIQSKSEHEMIMGDADMRIFLASVLLEKDEYTHHFLTRYINLYIESDISSMSQDWQYAFNMSGVINDIATCADFIVGIKKGKFSDSINNKYNVHLYSYLDNYIKEVMLKLNFNKAGHRRQILWFLLSQTKSGLYVFDDIWTVPQLKPSWLELFRYYKEIGVLEPTSIEDIQNVSVRKELPEGFVKLFNEVFNN